MRRTLSIVAISVVLLLVVGLIAGGWYYSDQLLPAEPTKDPVFEIDVLEVANGTVTLDRRGASEDYEQRDLVTEGIFGFMTPGGYVQLTTIEDQTDTTVTRAFEVVDNEIRAEERGEIQVYAYPDEPDVIGREVEELEIPGPLGDYPAWLFPADTEDWIVYVHGRGATRAETLRAVDHTVGLGFNALVITYRNDSMGPATSEGYGYFGDVEWRDLEAAIDWLLDTKDVEDLVLWGNSQGGAVVMNYLRRAAVPDELVASVLDSPILSLHETLRLQAAARGVPGFLLGPLLASATTVSELRSEIEFSNLEHVEAADEFDLPFLLFHGRDDVTIPFGPSEQFAAARPDLVTFVPYDGDHIRGWNVINEEYLAATTEFLSTWN